MVPASLSSRAKVIVHKVAVIKCTRSAKVGMLIMFVVVIIIIGTFNIVIFIVVIKNIQLTYTNTVCALRSHSMCCGCSVGQKLSGI